MARYYPATLRVAQAAAGGERSATVLHGGFGPKENACSCPCACDAPCLPAWSASRWSSPLSRRGRRGLDDISTDPFTQATCHASTTRTTTPTSSRTASPRARRSSRPSRSAASIDGGACAIGFAYLDQQRRHRLDERPAARYHQVDAGGGSERPCHRRLGRVRRPAQRLADLLPHAARSRRATWQCRGHQPCRPTAGSPGVIPVDDGDRGGPGQELDRLRQHLDQRVLRHCYTEWDDHGNGNRLQMSTSTDGGLTWSAPPDQQQRRHRRPAGRPARRDRDRADRQRQRDGGRRLQLDQRRGAWSARHDRHDRHHTAAGASARARCLGGDRRRRHGLCRVEPTAGSAGPAGPMTSC